MCNGARASTIWIVEQLGFAIILSVDVSALALISGTTNFLERSMRQADELSITVVPTSANFGANSREVPPPAEKIAISGLAAIASCIEEIVYSFCLYVTCLPTDRSDATGINSVIGKLRSASTCNITWPTIPVAPTTATLISISMY